MPFGYALDSKGEIANPLGLYGRRLGVDLYLICSKLASVQNLAHVISQSGYEIKDVLFSGLATSSVVFDFARESKNGLNLLCDIGSDVTELVVFRDGLLKDMQILPSGGDDFTRDLADTLKIPFLLAEDIKKSYGVIGDPEKIPEDKEVLVKKENFYNPIKQKVVCEILTSRAEGVSSALRQSVEKMVNTAEINNFVVCGRGVLLEGFLEMLEKNLQVRMKFGRILDADMATLAGKNDLLTGQKYLTYITAMGMVCHTLRLGRQFKGDPLVSHPGQNPAIRAINKIKEVYQEYF
jgi:cell division protein FtsA